MKKLILLSVIIFLSTLIFGQSVKSPSFVFKTKGLVNDFVRDGDFLYIATGEGIIQIINHTTKKLVSEIKLPHDKGKAQSIISIDKIAGENTFVIVSITASGKTAVFSHKEDKWRILNIPNDFLAQNAIFLNSNTIFVSLLGNEIIKYNLSKKRIILKKQVSNYGFSDISINKEKTKAAITDEGGTVNIVDTKTGSVLQSLDSENVDKIFQLDFKKDKIITAGKDRRVAIYNLKTGKSFHINNHFFIYSACLNDKASLGAYQKNEDCDISVFSIYTKSEQTILKGHNSLINKIYFLNDNTIISAGDDKKIMFWEF